VLGHGVGDEHDHQDRLEPRMSTRWSTVSRCHDPGGHHARHWLWLAVPLATMVLLSVGACAGLAGGPTGHVTGIVAARSGSVSPTPTPVTATVTATPSAGTSGHTYSTQTGADGSYSLNLPPGTYELSAVRTGQSAGDLATPEDDVTVVAGDTVRVDLYVNYPGPAGPWHG